MAAFAVPAVSLGAGGKRIPLKTLEPVFVATGGWGRAIWDKHPNGLTPMVAGKPCENFLLAHASSCLIYEIPKGYKEFVAVGVAPWPTGNQSWRYIVYIDGKRVFESKLLHEYPRGEAPIRVRIPKRSKTVFLLIDGHGDDNFDHAIWAEPAFEK